MSDQELSSKRAETDPTPPDGSKPSSSAVLQDELNLASAESGENISVQEMEFAQQALRLVPDLTEEQVEALRRRIRDGYYGSPTVVSKIAERLAELFRSE